MHLLNVTNNPIYLPLDRAPVPFGDPFVATVTSASPGVATVVGYTPTAGDAVSFSSTGATGAVPTGLTGGTTYYVVNPSGQTFQVSATKGGSAINTSSTGTNVVVHLLSNQVDGAINGLFKPTGSVIAVNLSGGTLILQGASDTGTTYGNQQGPGTWNTLVSLPTLSMARVDIQYDWLRVNTTGTIQLLQQ
jgi:hypothetical protein